MALGKRVSSPSPYTRSTSLVLRILLLQECDKPLSWRHWSPWFQALFCLCGLGYSLLFSSPAHAQSTTLVISQIYGGGGNKKATHQSDFIEIRNSGEEVVSTNAISMSIQYAPASSTDWEVTPLGEHIIPAGGFLLTRQITGTNGSDVGTALEAPDVMGGINIATGGGKVALVAKAEPISGIDDPDVIDFVGYGNNANEAEGVIIQDGQEQPAHGPASSNTKAIVRRDNGCTDSDNNANDFEADTPMPRNSTYVATPCSIHTVPITPTVAITTTLVATLTVTPSSTTPVPTIPVTLTVPTATVQPHNTTTLTTTTALTVVPSTLTLTIAITPTIATSANTPVPADPLPSPTLTSTLGPLATPTVVPTPTPAPRLWITEVMLDPAAVSDSAGEYIEIFNPSDFAVDLFGWILRDDSSDNHAVAENIVIPARGYVVLARNGDAAVNGGLEVDYVYSNLVLGNTADQLYLIAPDDTTIDFVSWNKEMSTPLSAGVSLERDALGESASWMLASMPWVGSAGDSGSPGQAAHRVVESTATPTVAQTPTLTADPVDTSANELITPTVSLGTLHPSPMPGTPTDSTQPTAESTDVSATPQPITPPPVATLEATPVPSPTAPPLLLISEVMVNPKVVADGSGEYIEIWNGESEAVNLAGYQLADLGSDVYVISDSLWISPNGFVLLARNNIPTENGGIQPDYLFSKLDLANGSDELLLLTPDGVEIDRIVWLEDEALSVEAGASFERVELSTTSTWIVSTEPWSGSLGDLGSPGQAYVSSANVNRDDADAGEYRTYYLPIHVSGHLSRVDASKKTPTATPPQNLAAHTATPTVAVTAASTPQVDTASFNATSDLYIGEVMPNPKAVTDSKGEFVEICNRGDGSLNLQSWSLSDLDKERHIIEEPLSVSARGCVVLGRNDLLAENGGVVVHYLYKGINLTNNADTLALLDPTGHTVDSVTWSEEEELISAAGASFEQIISSSPAQWRIASDPWAGSAGDFGSPGEMSTVQIVDAPSVVTPSATPSPHPTPASAVKDESPSAEQTSPTQTTLPPSTLDFEGGPAEMDNPRQDEPTLSPQVNLVTQSEPRTGADRVIHYPQIWITEFLADPIQVSDQKGEWLKLSNPNQEPVNLNGWMLADAGKERHLINTDLIVDAGKSILLARSAEVAHTLNAQVDYVYAGFTLANSADEILLIAPDDRVVDSIAWGNDTEVEVSAGTVFQRQLPDYGNQTDAITSVTELPDTVTEDINTEDIIGHDIELSDSERDETLVAETANRVGVSSAPPSPSDETMQTQPPQPAAVATSTSVPQKQTPVIPVANPHFKSSLSMKNELSLQSIIVARPSAQLQQEANALPENTTLSKVEPINWHKSSLAKMVIDGLDDTQTDDHTKLDSSHHEEVHHDENSRNESSSTALLTTCVDKITGSDDAEAEVLCGQIGSHEGLPTLFLRIVDIDTNRPDQADTPNGLTHIDPRFSVDEDGREANPHNEPQLDVQLNRITDAYMIMFILFMIGVIAIVALHWIMVRSTYHRLLELQNISTASSGRTEIET